jgi:hypothetical protein
MGTQAQRRGHKRQAKRLHRKAARFVPTRRAIVDEYQNIYVGDVIAT